MSQERKPILTPADARKVLHRMNMDAQALHREVAKSVDPDDTLLLSLSYLKADCERLFHKMGEYEIPK